LFGAQGDAREKEQSVPLCHQLKVYVEYIVRKLLGSAKLAELLKVITSAKRGRSVPGNRFFNVPGFVLALGGFLDRKEHRDSSGQYSARASSN
jgi:hypothetical protein